MSFAGSQKARWAEAQDLTGCWRWYTIMELGPKEDIILVMLRKLSLYDHEHESEGKMVDAE